MTKLKMLQENNDLKKKCKALEEELKYKEEVINNYKSSVETLKEEPGRAVQAELLELRRRTTADGFLVDELQKGLKESNDFITVLEKQIDSLSLLVGVVVEKLRAGVVPITKDGYIRLHQDDLREVHTNYDVVVRESDSGYVLIGCSPKKQTADETSDNDDENV